MPLRATGKRRALDLRSLSGASGHWIGLPPTAPGNFEVQKVVVLVRGKQLRRIPPIYRAKHPSCP